MRTLIILGCLLLGGVAVVLGVYGYAELRVVQQYNFHRDIHPAVVHLDTAIDLGRPQSYVAGIGSEKIWLAHPGSPRELLLIDGNMVDTVRIEGLPDSVRVAEVLVDSNIFYVMDLARY